jgi:sugar transferase (PEP-CTERM system associated)
MFRVFQNQESLSTFRDLFADALLCFLAVLLAAASLDLAPRGHDLTTLLLTPHVLLPAASFALVMALLYSFVGLYRHTHLSALSIVARLGVAFVLGGYFIYLLLKAADYNGHPARLVGYALMYVLAGLVLVRGTAWGVRKAMGARRMLIVGTAAEAANVLEGLGARGSRAHRRVVGVYPTSAKPCAQGELSGVRVFDRDTELEQVVRRHNISEIIVAAREQRGGSVPMDQLLACRIRGVRIMDFAGFYEQVKAEVPIDSLKGSWLVYGDGFVQGRARRAAKRVFDIVTSATLLVLAAPVMLLTAIAIKLDSRGPVIYSQERVGLGGRGFMCLKFRSMGTDAEKDGVAVWASKNDARVTRVGAFIRKTRIDELPQLFSVLKGEMSMVGPRPERPSFVKQLKEQIPYYDLRHSVKPGVTGWAQVRYSYGASVEDARRKHQFDLYYVKNNSLFLDLLVLIETVTVVLFREGAH